jgi:hypothetical protein
VAAKVCRFCQVEFDELGNLKPGTLAPLAGGPLAPPKPSSGIPTVVIVLIVVGVVAVVGLAFISIIAAIAIPNLLRSRMAANESAAIAGCKTYAEAQEIYRRTDWDGDGVLEYAQSIKGAYSLFERQAGAGDLQLVDSAFASAEDTGRGTAIPKAGYFFRVLTSQGPNAPGGREDYVSGGNMVLGYALVACPVEWDASGRNTFLINQTGTVYQKDLGAQTPQIVQQMTEYDPGPGWVPAE